MICGLFFHWGLYAQIQNKHDLIEKNINKLILSNPNNAIEITQLLLNQPNLKEKEKAKLYFQIARAYKVKGEFSSSLQYLYHDAIYEKHMSDFDLKFIQIGKADILIELSFYNEANKIIKEIEESLVNIKDEESKFIVEALLNLEIGKILYKKGKYNEALQLLKPNLEKTSDNYPEFKMWGNVSLGKCYLKTNNIALSKKYFENALEITKNNDLGNSYIKLYIFNGLAAVAFKEKEYDKAIKLLSQSYSHAIVLNNILLQVETIEMLKENFLAKNDIQNYKLYSAKFTEISGKFDTLNQEAVNTVFNLISEEQESEFSRKESFYYNVEYALLTILILLFIYFAIRFWRQFQKTSRLQDIINYLQITRNNFLDKIPFKKEKPKKMLIPKDTEELILNKLKKFETSKKYTSKDISLAVLAGQFDTNTKYLSEVINSHYQVNFNTYINKLRVNYIIEKIKKDPNFMNYKVSYLAEFCGFSSHSSFATVFKSITGLSPITFIDLIKGEKENIKENEL